MSRFDELLLEVIEMKKVIALFLCAVTMLLSFAGCAPKVPECEHDYTSRVVKKATYEEEGQIEYFCKICEDIYMEAIPKKVLRVIPNATLTDALSNIKFKNGMFSIGLGELVNRAVGNYDLTFVHGEEAIREGYIQKSDLERDVDPNYVYYVAVSGDVMVSPEIPYYTIYSATAIKGWMQFDENNKVVAYNLTLCENLRTCAILLMSGY